MSTLQYRFFLFIFGCIGVRLFLVYLAKTSQIAYLPYLGVITLLIGLGFAYIYLTDSRKSGAEVFGDKIWWNYLRPIHSLLYILFSIGAFLKIRNSWILLLIDVIIGLFSFLTHHYIAGNLTKIFIFK